MKKITLLLLALPVIAFSQIELKGFINPGTSGTDVWEYIDPNNGNVYAVIGGNGMTIIDVTDPASPVQTDHVPNVPGFDVKVWQNYVYCATGGGGDAKVVDISDPFNAVIVGTFPSAHNFHIDDRGYLYTSSPGTRIYDLNPDPTSPTFLTQVGSEGHDTTVRGNLLIDCHGFAGTFLYDVTDPGNPLLLGSIHDPDITYHHQGDISDNGEYLYICDELGNHPQADITVWDITDMANPVKVDEVADPDATPHNMYVIGDYGYASYYTAGFKVFDLTDPSQLVIADVYDTNGFNGEGFGGAFGVYPSPVTGNIYINDDTGIYIFGFDPGLGVDDADNVDFGMYPNPAAERVTVSVPNGNVESVVVYSIFGQQLFELSNLTNSGSHEFNISQLSTGVYFVRVNGSQAKKLVVK